MSIFTPTTTPKVEKKIINILTLINNKDLTVRGKKRIEKMIKAGEDCIVLLPVDITPIDLIIHLPSLCEEKSIRVIYMSSKEDLRFLSQRGGLSSCVLIKKKYGIDEIDERIEKVLSKLN